MLCIVDCVVLGGSAFIASSIRGRKGLVPTRMYSKCLAVSTNVGREDGSI